MSTMTLNARLAHLRNKHQTNRRAFSILAANVLVKNLIRKFMDERESGNTFIVSNFHGNNTVKLYIDAEIDRAEMLERIVDFMRDAEHVKTSSLRKGDSYSSIGSAELTVGYNGIQDSIIRVYVKCKRANGIRYEPMMITKLNKTLDGLKEELGTDYVKLIVGGNVHNVAKFVKTEDQRAKADFTALDENGQQVAWISYKHMNSSSNPTQSFQQWSGISNIYCKQIAEHQNTLDFGKLLNVLFPHGYCISGTLSMKISDPQLRNMCVYGYDYRENGEHGMNNVDTVLQGDCMIESADDDVYVLTADVEFANGTAVGLVENEDYTPTFICRRGKHRASYDIDNARALVYTKDGRANTDIFDYIDEHVVRVDAENVTKDIKEYMENNNIAIADLPLHFHMHDGQVITYISDENMDMLNGLRYEN